MPQHELQDKKKKSLKTQGAAAGSSTPYQDVMQLASMAGNSAMEGLLRHAAVKSSTGVGQPLPDHLRTRHENTSGVSLDDVRVHYNSPEPIPFMARAFAKGSEIHIVSGQEDTLEHEVAHTIQQKQGRVSPTGMINGEPVNDNAELEGEAEWGAVSKDQAVVSAKKAVIQRCYLCPNPACLRGELCGLPTGANTILATYTALTGAAPGGIIAARARVAAHIPGSPDFGFGGFTFHAHHPTGARFGFEPAIQAMLYAAPPMDAGGWIHCPYCGYEYPAARMQIDHIIPWQRYAMVLTGAATPAALGAMPAADVFVACNDPANLVLACDHCNPAKGALPLTAAWLAAIRAAADASGGF